VTAAPLGRRISPWGWPRRIGGWSASVATGRKWDHVFASNPLGRSRTNSIPAFRPSPRRATLGRLSIRDQTGRREVHCADKGKFNPPVLPGDAPLDTHKHSRTSFPENCLRPLLRAGAEFWRRFGADSQSVRPRGESDARHGSIKGQGQIFGNAYGQGADAAHLLPDNFLQRTRPSAGLGDYARTVWSGK